jgi:CheY-like chemotaxis protein
MRNRRRRTRARIAMGVHIRGGIGTLEAFDDFGTSLDVSRDGALVKTARGGYWAGQLLEVTCPYAEQMNSINTSRRAKVIRSVLTSTFSYALAIEYQRPPDDPAAAAWAARPYPNQVRVLGIESDARSAHAMKNALEQDGYHVLYVASAEQALNVLRSEIPDVLVMESEGGAISGLDLCAIVKTTDRLQHIPVILLTRSAMPSDYSAGRNLGAIVCMKKPCPIGQLQRAVHMVAPPPAEQTVYSGRFNIGTFVRTS